MFWLAIVALTVILLAGLARVLRSFRRRPNPASTDADSGLGRWQILSLGVADIAGSIVGFFFLFAKTFGPSIVILGVFGVTGLIDRAIRFSTKKART